MSDVAYASVILLPKDTFAGTVAVTDSWSGSAFEVILDKPSTPPGHSSTTVLALQGPNFFGSWPWNCQTTLFHCGYLAVSKISVPLSDLN